MNLLGGPGSTGRLAAAEALIQLGDPDAAIPTLKAMAGAPDTGTRDHAERLLASLRSGLEEP